MRKPSGFYNRRGKIKEIKGTADGQGGFDEGATVEKETWLHIEPMKGFRTLEAGQAVNGQPYKVTTRYRSDLVASSFTNGVPKRNMLLEIGGRNLSIKSLVNVDEMGQTLEFIAIDETT